MIQSHDLFTASELKNAGIQLAIQNAELKHTGWADEALNHLTDFIRTRRTPFMCEEVREYAEKRGLPKAPSNRAWGSIVQTAKKRQLINRVGTSIVSNKKAHCCFATLWVVA